MQHDDDFPQKTTTIYIGCVLIPVFIVVWYYYTKRVCRKYMRCLKNEPENTNDNNLGVSSSSMDFSSIEDVYCNHPHHRQQQQQQRDGAENYSPKVVSDRFVKWINRQNVVKGFQVHQIEKRTKENLFGKNEAVIAERSTINKEHDNYDDEDDNNVFWECVPNTRQLELCVTLKDVQSNTRSSRDSSSNNKNKYSNPNRSCTNIL
mmetsp:Transcript_27718/g.31034  ORF Transcript_27718/g.31034 Transcript_27718/m.31034 type:complete len:205 (+) Transcript_27718:72-686(+)